MNGLIEQILLVSSVLGFFLGIALILHIFMKQKANFFRFDCVAHGFGIVISLIENL
jgi:hypothetical protein